VPPPGHSEDLAAAVRSHRAGDLAAAEAAYRRALDADPRHPGALQLLGMLDHQRGRNDQALGRIGRAVALDPADAAARNHLGVVLKALGRLDEAIAAFGEALRLAPGYADALTNLGVALHARGRPAEARARFEAALGAAPDHVDALYNLGNLLLEAGDAASAAPLLGRAGELAPRRPDVLNNLGNALAALERPDEAVAAYRRALAAEPAHAEAWANLGAALAGQERIEEAADAYGSAARLRPHEPHWPLRIAALCPAVFPSAEAIDRYRIGLEAVLDAHRGGVRLPPGAAAASGIHPSFNLAHHGRDDRAIKAKFAAVFRANFPDRGPPPGGGVPRVGFVDSRPHEGMFLRCTAGIVDRLDPGRFRVVVFGPARGMAALRAAIRRPDAEFVPLPDRLPEAAAASAAARCDLLYHWQVGSDPFNYFLPFMRPAPVQVTSWGTHVTSGVPALDYYLSSVLIEPPGSEARYTEALLRLATLPTYQDPVPRPDPPPRRSEFGLPEGARLYACLQRLQKVHPDFDPLLAGILRRDPRGLILLLADRHGQAAARLAARFRAAMPDVAGRVAFLPRLSHAAYLRLLALADVALDPPHYGAGGTAYDILGLGVPLVTLPGARHVARYALGCYRKLGVMDPVADSPARYVELALRLGADRAYRDEVSARIAAAVPVLFEDAEAVREHERAFEQILAAARAGARSAAGPGPL